METNLTKPELKNMEITHQITFGKIALRELRILVQGRPDKLVIKGKQYLFYSDWQTLGAFFGITAYVMKTEQLTEDKPVGPLENGLIAKSPIGYWARAVAFKDGREISAAEAICMRSEENWAKKDLFQLNSMAQTRACAKALRNVLSWVIKLPDEKQPESPAFSEDIAEDQQQMKME